MAFPVILLVFFTVMIISLSIKIVPKQSVMIIERLGRFNRILPAGLNFAIPFIEKPKTIVWSIPNVHNRVLLPQKINCVPMWEIAYAHTERILITKDNASLSLDTVIYYQVADPLKTAYQIDDAPAAIEKLTTKIMRELVGGLTFDELLLSRDTVAEKLKEALSKAADIWGITINNTEIQAIIPSEELLDMMKTKMAEEQKRREEIIKNHLK